MSEEQPHRNTPPERKRRLSLVESVTAARRNSASYGSMPRFDDQQDGAMTPKTARRTLMSMARGNGPAPTGKQKSASVAPIGAESESKDKGPGEPRGRAGNGKTMVERLQAGEASEMQRKGSKGIMPVLGGLFQDKKRNPSTKVADTQIKTAKTLLEEHGNRLQQGKQLSSAASFVVNAGPLEEEKPAPNSRAKAKAGGSLQSAAPVVSADSQVAKGGPKEPGTAGERPGDTVSELGQSKRRKSRLSMARRASVMAAIGSKVGSYMGLAKKPKLPRLQTARNTAMEAAARSHSSSVMLKSEDGRMSCVIMPNSTKRVAWDVTTAVLLVYIAFTAPFRIAFNVDPVGFWYVLERFIDIFFIVDLAINFRTAYSNREGAIVTDVWKMAKHYLWTWFLIDFVSSVPVDLIFEWSAVNSEDVMGSEATQAGKLLKTSKILKTIRLAKMARMAKLGVLMEKFEDAYDLSKSGVKLVKLFSVLIVISHFNACGWYWVGSLTENPNESWLHYAELRVEDTTTGCENIERQVGCDDARMLHYLTSFYWAIMTTTTVGYGDISPKSDGERVYAILAMIVGGGYFGRSLQLAGYWHLQPCACCRCLITAPLSDSAVIPHLATLLVVVALSLGLIVDSCPSPVRLYHCEYGQSCAKD